jgi:hypothetical protein
MMHQEMVSAVHRGKRVETAYSTRPTVSPRDCPHHYQVAIACDEHTDILECIHCGTQSVISCIFALPQPQQGGSV